jgi:hypothetical protein
MSPTNPAILKRVEQVIGWLRDCHVCNGWAIDERGAERTLRYFRRMAKGGRDNMSQTAPSRVNMAPSLLQEDHYCSWLRWNNEWLLMVCWHGLSCL